jgi:hypothetical protein
MALFHILDDCFVVTRNKGVFLFHLAGRQRPACRVTPNAQILDWLPQND